MPIMVKDHALLHNAVGRACVAGGAAAVAALFLSPSLAAAVAVLALGVAVAPPRSLSSAAWALLCACFGGAAMKLGPAASMLGLSAAMGGSLARGVSGRWRLLAFALGGA